MTILGIDPGTTQIGYGVVSYQDNSFKAIEYGLIKNPGRVRSDDLISTYDQIVGLIDKYQPERIAIEKLFFATNQKTAMSVSEMRGVILLACARKGMPIIELTPLQVKSYISNYGKADKNQVQRIVRMILGIKEEIRPDDVTDALAIAICGTSNILSHK